MVKMNVLLKTIPALVFFGLLFQSCAYWMKDFYSFSHEIVVENSSHEDALVSVHHDRTGFIQKVTVAPGVKKKVFYRDAVEQPFEVIVEIKGANGKMRRQVEIDSERHLEAGELWHRYEILY